MGASVLLLLFAPLLLLVAAVVRLTSPGPALFAQDRYGLDGKIFRVYKFRTMFIDADDERHRSYVQGLIQGTTQSPDGIFKIAQDDRITPVGRALRKSSLDELPQLWNVLRGEMSLVGPRPVIGYEVELYTPRQRKRFETRPGITGLWQVSGRNLLSYNEMLELDAQYVERWTFKLDLWILLKTIPVVLTNSGRAR